MPDIVWNPIAGEPFSGQVRYVNCGDGTYAPLGMSIGGLVPVQSLANVSAIGPGIALDNAGVRNNHSLVVTSSAGVSAGAVMLQGSQDGTNWFSLLSAAVSINAASTTFAPATASLTPVRYLRANVTTAITGGTITAVVASA